MGGLSGYKVALSRARKTPTRSATWRLGQSLTVLLAIAGSASLCSAQSSSLPLVTDLSGKGWTVQNTNGSMTLDTSVPGYALEALVNAGKAPQAPREVSRSNAVILLATIWDHRTRGDSIAC